MGRYLLRRLGFALLLVLVVSSASLLLTRLAPGDVTTEQALVLDPRRAPGCVPSWAWIDRWPSST